MVRKTDVDGNGKIVVVLILVSSMEIYRLEEENEPNDGVSFLLFRELETNDEVFLCI